MKRKQQTIQPEDLSDAIITSITVVKEKVKETGMGFTGDCCFCGLKVPGLNTVGLISHIIFIGTGKNGPHFQKYELNEAAASTFCKVLTDRGYKAEYYCRLD